MCIYPLPRLEELVEQAAGHPYYVTLHMREAYFQIMLDEESRDLTTFVTGLLYIVLEGYFSGLTAPPQFSPDAWRPCSPLSYRRDGYGIT